MLEQKSWAELAAEASSEDTRNFVRRVKRASRRECTPEEKVRIVLEGFRDEIRVSKLCQRDSIRRDLERRVGFEPTTHGSEVGASTAGRAPITYVESRRPPIGGPRDACVVTISSARSGQRESNPRSPPEADVPPQLSGRSLPQPASCFRSAVPPRPVGA
jgi:transposase-like protein